MIDILPVPPSRLVEAASIAMLAWDRPGDPETLARELASGIALGAFQDGRLVGVATATLLGDGVARSEDTAVREEARGAGIGAALLEALMERLRGLGIREVWGESSIARLDSLAFFRRAGFEVVETEIARGKPWFREGEVVVRTRLRLAELGENPVIGFTEGLLGRGLD